ncbi:MAG TPA: TonB-dependent receptor plug domain-containing protein, partial [Thermoanaerobaculia bacterium]|nr:TonB-dependent receptor plug domain-containing protein [Thermoanaerobaculia bacterium]
MTLPRPLLPVSRSRLRWPLAFLAAAVLAHPLPGLTQDAGTREPSGAEESAELLPVTDEITVTATRTPRTLQEVPGAVSVIEAEEIELQGLETVRDLVRFEPGIYVEGDVTRLGLSGFNIRGIGGNRVATRIDGVATAEEFEFGPVTVHRYSLDLDLLKRVEIVRSAGSALYGSDALGGVVSFETKDPLDLLTRPGQRTAFSLKTGYDGRDEGFSQTLSTALGGPRWQGALFAGRNDARELDNFGGTGTVETRDTSRTAPNPQEHQSFDGLVKLTHQPSDTSSFKLTAERYHGETETEVLSLQGRANLAPTLPPGAVAYVDTTRYDALDTQSRGRLSLEQSYTQRNGGLFDRLGWRVFLQSSVTEQDTEELRRTTQGGGPLGPLRTSNVLRDGRLRFDQEEIGGEVELQKALLGSSSDPGPGMTHLLTYGVSWSENRFDQWRDRADRDLDTGDPDVYTGPLIYPTKYFPASDVRKAGVFVQDEM